MALVVCSTPSLNIVVIQISTVCTYAKYIHCYVTFEISVTSALSGNDRDI